MLIAVTLRSIKRRAGIWLKVLLVLVLVLYILPQLVLLLWNTNEMDPKLKEPAIERPLRVENCIYHFEKIYKNI